MANTTTLTVLHSLGLAVYIFVGQIVRFWPLLFQRNFRDNASPQKEPASSHFPWASEPKASMIVFRTWSLPMLLPLNLDFPAMFVLHVLKITEVLIQISTKVQGSSQHPKYTTISNMSPPCGYHFPWINGLEMLGAPLVLCIADCPILDMYGFSSPSRYLAHRSGRETCPTWRKERGIENHWDISRWLMLLGFLVPSDAPQLSIN